MDPIPPALLSAALVNYRNTIPRIYYAVFQGSIDAGFNQAQAFAILQTYILSQNPNGIRPPDAVDPQKEMDK